MGQELFWVLMLEEQLRNEGLTSLADFCIPPKQGKCFGITHRYKP